MKRTANQLPEAGVTVLVWHDFMHYWTPAKIEDNRWDIFDDEARTRSIDTFEWWQDQPAPPPDERHT